MLVTQVLSNANQLLWVNKSGVYLRTADDMGVFLQPTGTNVNGWRHVNGRPRRLNFKKMTPYHGVIILAQK